MAERLGIGVVGTGRIAHSHMRTMAQHEPSEVVAVMDVIPEKVEQFAEEFGIPTRYTRLDDLLGNPKIDAVIVSTPPFAHMQPTLDALAAGKHVLCEKPFSLDPAEAERMVAAAESSGKFLAVASARHRLGQAALKAHQLVAAGDLGHVYHVRYSRFRVRGRPGIDMFQDAVWFLDKQRAGGGAIMDIGVYQIDLALWLLGNPLVSSVVASMYQGIGVPPPEGVKQDVEDHAVITMACKNGASAIVETAWASNVAGADALLVFGTDAGLRFDPLTKITAGPDRKAIEQPVFEHEEPRTMGGGISRVTASFVEDVLAGRQPMTPPRDALEVTRVMAAAYRSVETGRAVSLG